MFSLLVDGGEFKTKDKQFSVKEAEFWGKMQTDRHNIHIGVYFFFPAWCIRVVNNSEKLVKIIRQTYRLFLYICA